MMSVKSQVKKILKKLIGKKFIVPKQQEFTPFITIEFPLFIKPVQFNHLEALNTVIDYISEDSDINISEEILEKSLDSYLSKDNYGIPKTADREGYHNDHHYNWWLSGLNDYLKIKFYMKKHNFVFEQHTKFYEFGCASGRVLRHFLIQEDNLQVMGSDINVRHIEWMRQFLPKKAIIFQNTTLPNLPIESNSIDIVAAFSVFTHIQDFEFGWLMEIRRILKQEGIAYITVHTDSTWEKMKPGFPVYDALLNQIWTFNNSNVTSEFLASEMPQPRMEFISQTTKVYNSNIFHSRDYLLSEWSRFLEILEIIDSGHGYQDVVLLRKN